MESVIEAVALRQSPMLPLTVSKKSYYALNDQPVHNFLSKDFILYFLFKVQHTAFELMEDQEPGKGDTLTSKHTHVVSPCNRSKIQNTDNAQENSSLYPSFLPFATIFITPMCKSIK